MPLSRKLDYVILDLIESAARVVKTAPLNLGSFGGAAGGEGAPPGGIVGWLRQTSVAYDEDELATLDTAPSGYASPSGWSLLDNLNHIRYRLGTLESGILVVDEYDGSPSIPNTTRITFSGGAEVSQLAPGHVLVNITASGGTGSGIAGIDIKEDSVLEGTAITVLNFTGPGVEVSVVGNEATVTISGGGTTVSGSLLHKYNDDLTPEVDRSLFTTSEIYASGTLQVYYNGLRQRKSIHYLDDVNFTTFSTYFVVPSGESFIVDYDYVNTDSLLTDSYAHFLTESL